MRASPGPSSLSVARELETAPVAYRVLYRDRFSTLLSLWTAVDLCRIRKLHRPSPKRKRVNRIRIVCYTLAAVSGAAGPRNNSMLATSSPVLRHVRFSRCPMAASQPEAQTAQTLRATPSAQPVRPLVKLCRNSLSVRAFHPIGFVPSMVN